MKNSTKKTKVKAPFNHMNDFWLIDQGQYLFSSIQTEPRHYVFTLIDSQERKILAVDDIDVHFPDNEKGHDRFAMVIWKYVNNCISKFDFIMSAHEDKCEGLPFNLDYIVHNQRAQIKCPYCGSKDNALILYGKPMMTDSLQDRINRKKVIIGGCCLEIAEVRGNTISISPKRHCNGCGKDYGTPPVFVSDKSVKDYLSDIASISFSRRATRGPSYTTVLFTKTADGGLVESRIVFSGTIGSYSETIDQKKWDSILNRLFNEMYMHEWPTRYASEFEKDGETWIIMDGEEWSIDIQFVDGSHRIYEGGNNYPTYWNELCRLMAPYARTFGKKHG